MRRRDFIALVGAIALSRSAAAQTKAPVIGVLLVGNREPFDSEFRAGLSDAGYTDGANIRLEYRSAEGKLTALPELAADLVRLGIDVLVASETPAVAAAKSATTSVPIVMAPAGDPLGTGLVASLAHPGGNVTGLSAATAELAGKSLELVREIIPGVRVIAALADPSNPFSKSFLREIHRTASGLGVNILVVNVKVPEDFESAFAGMKREGAEAVVVQPTLPRKPVIGLALKHRLPSVSGNRAFPTEGGLMSYSGSLADRHRNAAHYVVQILKGTKPADLPVQQPLKFELVLNQRTAKAIGIMFPPTLLARADEVIE